MKAVFSKSELPHVWAKQSQQEGRTPTKNMYFDGAKIYSYGRHFCMANIIAPNVVLITDRTYSVTTSAQMSLVRYAVNHMERIFIPYPEEDLRDNAKAIIDRIKANIEIIGNTRKRPSTKESAKGSLASIVSNVERYCEVTHQKLSKKWAYDTDLQKEFNLYFKAAKSEQATEQLGAKLEKLAIAKKKVETKKQIEAIEKWLNGENIYIHNSDKVYLRVIDSYPLINGGKEIETSKGARVSVKSGKLLFDMIQAGKDIVGHDIDGYTVIRLNGILKIGCHEIERAEIERFAKSQNWI